MNLLTFCGKILLCLGISFLISLPIITACLLVALVTINLLQLNYESNSYLMLNLCVIVWFLAWFLTYSYLLTL